MPEVRDILLHPEPKTIVMKTLITTITSLFAASVMLAQTGVIAVQHADGSPTSFYYMPTTTLNQVLTTFVGTNDTIYLPGGTIPFSSITLNTKVTIVGAGFHQSGVPVTQKTVIPSVNFGFGVGAGANGSSFHGIDFESSISLGSGVANITFTRCEFASVSLNPNFNNDPLHIHFKQCLLRSALQGGETSDVTLDNCVLENGPTFSASASGNYIRHCLFLNANLSTTQSTSVTYSDNIFVFGSGGPAINNTGQFYNNLFALPVSSLPIYGLGVFVGNQTMYPASNLFLAGTSLTSFDYSDDYALLSGTMALTMPHYDGTQAGIHGGLAGSPWKPLAIPYDPHWELLIVPPATVGGVLQGVQIQGSAQSN